MIKKNKISILVLLLLTIVAAWYFIKDSKNTLSKSETSLTINDSSNIATIKIINKNFTLLLTKQSDGWKLDNQYDADHQMLELCLKVLTQTEISSTIPKATAKQIAYTIVASGSEVLVMNIKQLSIQHIYIFGDTRNRIIYMMQASDRKPYIVELPGIKGNIAGIFKMDAKEWRNKIILSLMSNQINSICIENVDSPDQSFIIHADGNNKPILTKTHDNKPLHYNIEAMKTYFLCFRKIKALDFVKNEAVVADSLKKEKSDFKLSITDINQNKKQMSLYKIIENGKINPNFCFALINGQEVAVIKYIETDLLTRNLNFFIK
jgi:hypothetical protein